MKRKHTTPKMKRVFTLKAWAKSHGDKIESLEIIKRALITGWPQECEGKTVEEIRDLGYMCLDVWTEEIEVLA
jgi:hypothetical protein